jgi:hypothetical protein
MCWVIWVSFRPNTARDFVHLFGQLTRGEDFFLEKDIGENDNQAFVVAQLFNQLAEGRFSDGPADRSSDRQRQARKPLSS